MKLSYFHSIKLKSHANPIKSALRGPSYSFILLDAFAGTTEYLVLTLHLLTT